MSGICGIPRRGSLSLVGCWDWPVSSTEGSCDLWILMCMFGKIVRIWDYISITQFGIIYTNTYIHSPSIPSFI